MANSRDFDARYELREFPFANGADGEPTPESLAALDAIGFGFHESTPKPEARKRKVNELIADEAVLLGAYVRKPQPGSVDETWPAGTFSWFPKALSWGDGTSINTQAISDVTVRPTERRRGILRRMMTQALERGVADGYAIAALTASEGTIYRRFGFGSAIRERNVVVKRAKALPFLAPTSGIVSVVTPEYLVDGVARQVFDRFDERSIGSMVRNTGSWPLVLGTLGRDGEPAKDTRAAVHRPADGEEVDGYVTWRMVEQPGGQTGIEIIDLVYATDAAYLSLWEFLLSIDLNDVVKYNRARLDDPIVSALGDNRAYDIEHEEDHVWLRVLDLPAVLASRPFAVDGTLTIAVTDALGYAAGTFRLEVTGGRGTAMKLSNETDAAGADLALDVADLGSLLLGAVSPVSLAAAGVLQAADPAAPLLLRSMLQTPRAPHGITFF
ncbi:GNAT family N-acetyltransferase [Plantibacter sp. 2H11-2]|uniref:GNAT family N-acetyltransferase n=1 Tax=Plantibacter sp. 2H11-2 TaxID=3414431 RepID=UPI003CF60A86